MVKIYVLRYGHRPSRDGRITTHVALVARAFGAHGFILADVYDEKVVSSLKKVLETWGGSMAVEAGVGHRQYIEKWRSNGGVVVHLTMYGVNVDEIIDEISGLGRDILVVVGAEKVPGYIYRLADYNVAIGNQPHSEVAALAVFLDRFYGGRELYSVFENAKVRVIPSRRGKRVVRVA